MSLHCTLQMCGKSNWALRSTFLSALGDKAVQKWRSTSLRRDKSLLYIIILSCWDSFGSAFCSNFISFRLALLTSKWGTTKCYRGGVTIFYHPASVIPALSVHQAEAFTNTNSLHGSSLKSGLLIRWRNGPTMHVGCFVLLVCILHIFVNLILLKRFGLSFSNSKQTKKVISKVNFSQRMSEILCGLKIWFTIWQSKKVL